MRIENLTKEQWLELRRGKITSTIASAVIGKNPYLTNTKAYQIVKGLIEPDDISNKEYVIKGNKAEDHIRKLFALDHPQYEVEVIEEGTYSIFISDKHPYIAASGDGKVLDKESGKKGLLEIKTTEILSSIHKEKWSFSKEEGVLIPEQYYIQVLCEMYCAEVDFVILVVELKYSDESTARRTIRINREEVQEEMDYLIDELVRFYESNILKGVEPPLIINL